MPDWAFSANEVKSPVDDALAGLSLANTIGVGRCDNEAVCGSLLSGVRLALPSAILDPLEAEIGSGNR
jgi:hypothetical protein